MNIKKIMLVVTLFVSSFSISPQIFAATTTTTTSTLDTQAIAQIEYTLPYPGILPDHPLYFLKKLRDQIMERLIADPVRKIEFYMLQADKSINTGLFLAAKQNETLAQESFVRGQKFYAQAVQLAGEIKAQDKEVPPYLVERFTNAGAKYVEVLTELKATDLVESVKKLSADIAKLK